MKYLRYIINYEWQNAPSDQAPATITLVFAPFLVEGNKKLVTDDTDRHKSRLIIRSAFIRANLWLNSFFSLCPLWRILVTSPLPVDALGKCAVGARGALSANAEVILAAVLAV